MNILVYEHPCDNPGAEWAIFRLDDAPQLRKYLSKHPKYKHIKCDRIHSQEVFLREDDFKELAAAGVIPHRFIQHRGEAVFIKAGCAHQVNIQIVIVHSLYLLGSRQVRNLGPCIKVAVDFLDTTALPTTLQIAKDLQKRRIPDVLLHRHVLWHAWHSIYNMLETGHGIKLHNRQQRINVHGRKSDKGQNRHAQHDRDIALKRNDFTAKGYDATFRFRCPDVACGSINKMFSANGVFSHM